MKTFIGLVVLVLSNISTVQAAGVEYTVKSLSCMTGANVNMVETLALGERVYFTNKSESEETRNQNGFIFRHKITNQGFQYRSGQPPCPTGDTLIIEFSR